MEEKNIGIVNNMNQLISLSQQVSPLHNMTLYETIDIEKLKKLMNTSNLLTYNPEYKEIEVLKKYIQNYDEKKKMIKVKYVRSNKYLYYGRVNPLNNMGLHNLKRHTRHTIVKDLIDIDIVNCHPSILYQISKKLNLKCSCIKQYITDREIIFRRLTRKYNISSDIVKELFIRLTNSGSFKGWVKENKILNSETDDFINNYSKEIKDISKIILNKNEELVKFIKLQDSKKSKASIFAYYLQTIECYFLEEMFSYLRFNKYIDNICVLSNDGLMIPKKSFTSELLPKLEKCIKDKYDIDIKLKVKGFDLAFDDDEIEDNQAEKSYNFDLTKYEKFDNNLMNKILDEQNIEDAVEYFNKYAFTVTKPNLYYGLKNYENGYISSYEIYKEQEFKSRYESFGFYDFKKRWVSVINAWKRNNKLSKHYVEDFDYLPNKYMLPNSNIINYWYDWKYKYNEHFKVDMNEIKNINYHVKNVLSNGDEVFYTYLMKWLKSVLIGKNVPTSFCFTGNQGVGKNIFFEFFGKKIIGKYYVYVNNIDSVTKNFNSHMAQKSFCLCDELDTWAGDIKTSNLLKSITTNTEILLENKGKDARNISNSLNYVFLSNERDVLRVEGKGDRRYIPIHLEGQPKSKQYYDNLASDFKSKKIAEHYFHYIMSFDLSNFNPRDKPITNELIRNQINYTPQVVSFLKCILECLKEKNQNISIKELYTIYKNYCKNNDLDFKKKNITHSKFSRLLTKHIGVEFRKRTNSQRLFSITKGDILKQLKYYDNKYVFDEHIMDFNLLDVEICDNSDDDL